jgi:hypothetical protein
MKLYLALSCLQTRPMADAWEELLGSHRTAFS